MNDYTNLDSGPRNQTLIVVEGKREKDYILKILLKSFQEIPIQMEIFMFMRVISMIYIVK